MIAAGAGSDPELADLRQEMDLARFTRMRRNARRLARAGHLREGLRAREVADVLWVCSSPELYDLLVRRRGWALTRYARFIVDVMCAVLLKR